MLYPSDEDWGKWGIEADLHRFFTLHWVELFSNEALDTWQLRTTNLASALGELAQCVETSVSHPPFAHNLPVILEEVEHLLSNDPVARRHFGHLRDHFAPYFGKSISSAEHARVARAARVSLGHLRGYRDHLAADLRALLNGRSNQKEDLSFHTTALATMLSCDGYSREFLATTVDHLLEPGMASVTDRFDALLGRCDGQKREYAVTFRVSWAPQLSREALPKLGIVFTKGAPPAVDDAEKRFYAGAGEREMFATVTVPALDPYSAQHDAERKLADVFASATFYHPARTYEVKGDSVLVSEGNSAPRVFDRRLPAADFLPDAGFTVRRIERVLSLYGRVRPEVAEQLSASLEYYRIALLAPTDEARLINFWMALECLLSAGEGPIVERICGYLPRSIALLNGYKLLRGLAAYIRGLWRNGDARPFREIFPGSTKRHLPPTDLLDVLVDRPNGERIEKLYGLCGSHALIRYRVWRLRFKTFRRPAMLRENLERNRKNIDWQLRRIYRCRNDIIHRGASPSGVRHLGQHLRAYVSFTIHALLHDLDTLDSAWSIEDTMENRVAMYRRVTNLLESDTDCQLPKRAVMYPEAVFDQGDRLWAQ